MSAKLGPGIVDRLVVRGVGPVDYVAGVSPAAPPRAVQQGRSVQHLVLPADNLRVAAGAPLLERAPASVGRLTALVCAHIHNAICPSPSPEITR